MNISQVRTQVDSYRHQLEVYKNREHLGVVFTELRGGFLIPEIFPGECLEIKEAFLDKGAKLFLKDPDCIDVLPARESFESFLSLTLIYVEESL